MNQAAATCRLKPSSHRTRSTATIVQSILVSTYRVCFVLRLFSVRTSAQVFVRTPNTMAWKAALLIHKTDTSSEVRTCRVCGVRNATTLRSTSTTGASRRRSCRQYSRKTGSIDLRFLPISVGIVSVMPNRLFVNYRSRSSGSGRRDKALRSDPKRFFLCVFILLRRPLPAGPPLYCLHKRVRTSRRRRLARECCETSCACRKWREWSLVLLHDRTFQREAGEHAFRARVSQHFSVRSSNPFRRMLAADWSGSNRSFAR